VSAEAGGSILQVDWILAVATIVNFIIFAFILKKLMFKPLNDQITGRQKEVSDALAKADEAQKKADQMSEDIRKWKSEAMDDIGKLKKENEDRLAKQKIELTALAKEDIARLKETSAKQLEAWKIEQEKNLQAQLTDIVSDITKKVLKREVKVEDHDELVNKTYNELVR